MTPTSDERHEVAERMRVYSHDFDFGDSDPLWYVAKAAFGDVDVHTYYSVFARLADLIDPTCNVVTSGEWRGRPIGSACSKCHAPLYPSTAWAHGMRYCSQCGSRVVDDGQ